MDACLFPICGYHDWPDLCLGSGCSGQTTEEVSEFTTTRTQVIKSGLMGFVFSNGSTSSSISVESFFFVVLIKGKPVISPGFCFSILWSLFWSMGNWICVELSQVNVFPILSMEYYRFLVEMIMVKEDLCNMTVDCIQMI